MRITYHIGTEKKWNGKSISQDCQVTFKKQAFLSIAKVFGGYTAVEGLGGWVDDNGELVQEKCLVITVVTKDFASVSDLRTARELAEHLRDLFGQASVLMTMDQLVTSELV